MELAAKRAQEKVTSAGAGRGSAGGGGGSLIAASAAAATSLIGKELVVSRGKARRVVRVLKAASAASGGASSGGSAYALQLRVALESGRIGRLIAQLLFPLAIALAASAYAWELRPALLSSVAVQTRLVPRALVWLVHLFLVVGATVASGCYCFASIRRPEARPAVSYFFNR